MFSLEGWDFDLLYVGLIQYSKVSQKTTLSTVEDYAFFMNGDGLIYEDTVFMKIGQKIIHCENMTYFFPTLLFLKSKSNVWP